MKMPRGRLVAASGFAIAVLAGVSTQAAIAQESFFPGLVFHPEDKGSDDGVAEIWSRQLIALKEPSLWRRSREDKAATIYRFLWLGSDEHPTCVRISRSSTAPAMHVSRHDEHPGVLTDQDRPKLIIDREEKLPLDRWQGIVDRLEAAKFWTDPTETPKNRGIADGDLLIIEGIKDGKYHVVVRHRSIAGKDYEPIFKSVLDTAGPEVAGSWDDHTKRSYIREFFEKQNAEESPRVPAPQPSRSSRPRNPRRT